jgi:ATPase complex subunit ATP10
MFLTAIRTRTPAPLQSTYLISRQNMEYLRDPLGMVNKHVGYVYLVDENAKIRWAGCGFAREEETEALRNCARVLLRRLDRTSAAGSGSVGADMPPLSSSE